MKRRAIALFCLAGCGQAPTMVTASVRIDALLRDEVSALDIYALGPDRSDDLQLTCPSLLAADIAPSDARVDGLAHVQVPFSATASREVVLDKIEAGSDRLVFVEARDAGAVLIGVGCEDHISVKEGETTDVQITVFRK